MATLSKASPAASSTVFENPKDFRNERHHDWELIVEWVLELEDKRAFEIEHEINDSKLEDYLVSFELELARERMSLFKELVEAKKIFMKNLAQPKKNIKMKQRIIDEFKAEAESEAESEADIPWAVGKYFD